MAHEVNFDGIVGPTHNYSGLSFGNIASTQHKSSTSNPKEAALQGLKKMKFLTDLGIMQAVLPPQERPSIQTLKNLGFSGSDEKIIENVAKTTPELLYACSSASAMWTANAATTAPSSDTLDHLFHITPANLSSKFHRSIEAETTSAILQAIFNSPVLFTVHSPLPSGNFFSDEGAANHTRFCPSYGKQGIHLFVYGREGFNNSTESPTRFPSRHTLEASQSIARKHKLSKDQVIFAQQNPAAIDAGVFHNDVISVGNLNVFLYHEQAFVETDTIIDEIRRKALQQCDMDMLFLKITTAQLSLADAVNSYLFNSQLVSLPDGSMLLLAPEECEKLPAVRDLLDNIILDTNNPINDVHYFDLRESMWNGGGPACLRLRVVLTKHELSQMNQNVFLNNQLYDRLVLWVEKHYRDSLSPNDLADPQLLNEGKKALDELTQLLKLGSIYSFQR